MCTLMKDGLTIMSLFGDSWEVPDPRLGPDAPQKYPPSLEQVDFHNIVERTNILLVCDLGSPVESHTPRDWEFANKLVASAADLIMPLEFVFVIIAPQRIVKIIRLCQSTFLSRFHAL